MLRVESYCAACPIRLVDVERHGEHIAEDRIATARLEEKVLGIDHWMHDGGNPITMERRVRALEHSWSRMVGAGTLAAILVTTALASLAAAIAWLAR